MFTSKTIVPVDRNETDTIKSKLGSDELRDTYGLDTCVEWIVNHEAKKVCLQFPDSLLHHSVDIALHLETKLGYKVYILGDTSYGSCCVDDVAAQHIGADAIIHFGHYCLSPTARLPVLYVFEKQPIDIPSFVSYFKQAFPTHSCKVLLLYDVAYKHAIDDIAGLLSVSYDCLAVSRLFLDEPGYKRSHSILGRNFDLEEGVEIDKYEVVFIGQDGHTLKTLVHVMPGTRFYLFDPSIHQSIEHYEFDRSKFHRRRMYLIEKIKHAKTLGILIGTLTVASYRRAVERIKALAKRMDKRCYIIAVGKPNIAKLANFPEVEAYVLVACPENSLLDSKEFLQPIVTMYEVELALNSEQVWSERHITDFRTLLPGGCNYVQEKYFTEDLMTGASNISLINGQLHQIKRTDELQEQNEGPGAILLKSNTTLSHSLSSGGYYLSSRSWTGLEQSLGKSEVELPTSGRQGIPQKYSNEQHE